MFDCLIIGAGPAGLSLAKLLSAQGRTIGVLERQSLTSLASPAFDGREIALTQHSMALLTKMGVVPHFQQDEYADLQAAIVRNGNGKFHLNFTPPASSDLGLGFMVSNHAIRRGLFQEVNKVAEVEMITDDGWESIQSHSDYIQVTTTAGKQLRSRLLIAADSRFSNTRKQMGIGAKMTDFGKTMLVCRMSHTQPHDDTAYEFFDYRQTLAILPLTGKCSSVVITLPPAEIEALLALDAIAFTSEIEQRLKFKFGAMQLVSDRFAYPLIAVYADRFVANRFALIGDAAVGMHPVTAHGFNCSLLGAETLAHQLSKVSDAAVNSALSRFEHQLKRDTLPLYLGTNAIAKLYTDDRLPARVIRAAGLRVANGLIPIKRKVVSRLMQL